MAENDETKRICNLVHVEGEECSAIKKGFPAKPNKVNFPLKFLSPFHSQLSMHAVNSL